MYQNCNTNQITLPQGPRGYTPYIGSNGNWWINNEDTGVLATGVSTAVDALDTRLDTAETDILALEAADTAIDARLDALEVINPPTVNRLKITFDQTGIGAPIISHTFIDDLSGIFGYTSPGLYTYTKTGAFPTLEKVFIKANNGYFGVNTCVRVEDANTLLISVTDLAGVVQNSAIFQMNLEIEIYP